MDPFIVAVASAVAFAGIFTATWFRRRAMLAESEAERLRYEVLDERIAARKDPVTGMLNSKGFAELGAVLATDQSSWPLVAVTVDIENFRQLSASCGQPAVDKILTAIGRRLGDYTAGPVVARLDGTRFAALLTSTIASDGSHYPHVRELARLLSEPVWAAGHLYRLKVLVGVANVDTSGDLAHALSKAETSMRASSPEFDQASRVPVQFVPPPQASSGLSPLYYRSRVIARHQRRPKPSGRSSTARATNID